MCEIAGKYPRNVSYTIRPALARDKVAIAGFTRDTFSWGDYVADKFDEWIEDSSGQVIVAADDMDNAIAVSRVSLLSPAEAWFQGARVREDCRRQGIAGAMAEFGTRWARQRGALVGRLVIEHWNAAARAQVEREGFRAAGDWVRAHRPLGAASPVPADNGGRRITAMEQLVPAPVAEAEPAFISWSSGPLARAARGLFAVAWTWRRLIDTDLEAAGRHDGLWMVRSGWGMAAPRGDLFEVGWIETREENAVDLMRALVDHATRRNAKSIGIMMPEVDWLTTAARQAGCDLDHYSVCEIAL